MIDRHMMEQVLMNLVLNAIQAMRNGGVLTIRTSMDEAHCLVRIQDSGCGISSSVLPRIFRSLLYHEE
jgi:signal transduction histidine kinase